MFFLKKIDKFLATFAIVFIRIYQYILSPDKGIPSLWLKGRICSHEPHCSEYGIRVLQRYGFFRGCFFAIDRILHCTPKMQKQYDPDHYKVIFFSSAPIGVPFFEALIHDKRFEVVGVVSMPDAPSGRGMQIQENVIKKEAKKFNNDPDFVITPSKINPEKSEEGKQFAERLRKKESDFFVVIAYGKIIPQVILDIPKIASINVHGSLLPKYRGSSPLQSVFLHDEKETGITIIKMDAGLDTGNIIHTLKFKIPFAWTVRDLIEKIQSIGPQFLLDTLWKYGKGFFREIPQNSSMATYCYKIQKESGLIDPRKDSLQNIYPKYRGFFLWPKVYFYLSNETLNKNFRVIIEQMELDEKEYHLKNHLPLIDSNNFLHPAIKKLLVKPEGSKIMERNAFVHGYLK